jgi:hypothetical protein
MKVKPGEYIPWYLGDNWVTKDSEIGFPLPEGTG